MVAQTAMLVFSKAPVPGQAKRRLIPALGASGAAQLQRRMTEKTVGTAAAFGGVQLWCSPAPHHSLFRRLQRAYGVVLRHQRGSDLGERMSNAFGEALREARAALLVGSDCPFLEPEDLRIASERLAEGCEAVFIPSLDGGYVLVGLAKPAPDIFQDVPWGSSEVMDVTRRRLRAMGWAWSELPPKRDIDRPEDLSSLGPEWFAPNGPPAGTFLGR